MFADFMGKSVGLAVLIFSCGYPGYPRKSNSPPLLLLYSDCPTPRISDLQNSDNRARIEICGSSVCCH
jgi:hypothetical protein